MSIRCCAIVPSRNHHTAMPEIVQGLRAAGLPVFVIDDGSDEPAASALAALHAPGDGIAVLRLAVNGGKGAAMVEGFRRALSDGYSHALQIDADGQHDIAAVPVLLDLAQRHPAALIAARPIYDGSVPMGRRLGRWLTHVWVFVETLSFRIRDSMCGLRVYPLAAVGALLQQESVGRRMDFDTEIMVRLFWRGVAPVQPAVRVIYPAGNTSNFDLWRDNVRITRMHLRLIGTMLLRLSSILSQRPPALPEARHWASLRERGMYWGLRVLILAWRLLGRSGCLAVAAPVVLYFYLSGRTQRLASLAFLRRVRLLRGEAPPGFLDGYRHFMAFAGRALDTLMAWMGTIGRREIHPVDPELLQRIEGDPRGAILIVSHHGNVDVARAALDAPTRKRLVVLVHTHHALNYNRVLREANPDAAVDMVQVSEIGPDTAVMLKEQVEAGRWLVIAGDRPPLHGERHVARLPFLGDVAPFALGPFILAGIMGCPVNLLFCRRDGNGFVLSLERFADRIDLPRGRRQAALAGYAAGYARRLEKEALAAPLQWYNFFDFWAKA